MKAIIVLEDGASFEGSGFGAEGEVLGEVVFNTQVVGYQEIITDPAYRKQVVVMGYPQIGNYGINDFCSESDSAQISALIVKENSKIYSNWQAKGSLADFMEKNNVIGVEGIDTRSLLVHIRDHGEMRAIVSTKSFNKENLAARAREYEIPNLISEIKAPSSSAKAGKVIINLGINKSVLEKYSGAKLVSYKTTADEILKMEPEQVIISSGPGDPRKLSRLIEEVKKLVDKVSLFGIQNGACVLASALGCSVYRMRVGHHGVNHPVVDAKTGRGEITCQNHSYGIERLGNGVEAVNINLNDKTIESFRSGDGKCEGILYFPIDERGKLRKDYQKI